MRDVPNFLGIGAPRSGSTWLHQMLSRHPGVYLPPIKEVHYFDSVDPEINESFKVYSTAWRWRRLAINRLRHYAGATLSPLVPDFKIRAKPDLSWDCRFFRPGGDIRWYRSLFKRASVKYGVVGEITPAYIMLNGDTIKKIKEETGVERIFVVLRNPISATWSCVEKQYRDIIRLSPNRPKFSHDEVMRKIRSPGLFARYNYAKNLSNWYQHYGKDQLFVAFYEELGEDPQGLLSRIFQFLGVEDVSRALMDHSGQFPVANAARGVLGNIPSSAKSMLAEMHAAPVGRLAEMIGGKAFLWQKDIEEALRGPKLV